MAAAAAVAAAAAAAAVGLAVCVGGCGLGVWSTRPRARSTRSIAGKSIVSARRALARRSLSNPCVLRRSRPSW
jgi:hypothetical protein